MLDNLKDRLCIKYKCRELHHYHDGKEITIAIYKLILDIQNGIPLTYFLFSKYIQHIHGGDTCSFINH